MISKLAQLNAKSDPEIGRVNQPLKCEFNIIVETTAEITVVACATRMLLQQRPYYCRHTKNNNIAITALQHSE